MRANARRPVKRAAPESLPTPLFPTPLDWSELWRDGPDRRCAQTRARQPPSRMQSTRRCTRAGGGGTPTGSAGTTTTGTYVCGGTAWTERRISATWASDSIRICPCRCRLSHSSRSREISRCVSLMRSPGPSPRLPRARRGASRPWGPGRGAPVGRGSAGRLSGPAPGRPPPRASPGLCPRRPQAPPGDPPKVACGRGLRGGLGGCLWGGARGCRRRRRAAGVRRRLGWGRGATLIGHAVPPETRDGNLARKRAQTQGARYRLPPR